MSEEITICERCKEPVEPDGDDVERAYEKYRDTTMDDPVEHYTLSDTATLFHKRCFPVGSSKYVRQ